MRMRHRLLFIALTGWFAVALIWLFDAIVADTGAVPIELAFMAAFIVAACVGGWFVDTLGAAIAGTADLGGERVSLRRAAASAWGELRWRIGELRRAAGRVGRRPSASSLRRTGVVVARRIDRADAEP